MNEERLCKTCKIILPVADFYKKRNNCRKCVEIRRAKWKLENKEQVERVHRKSCADYHKRLKWIKNQVLLFNPCIICNEKRIGCLDFHHINPSIKDNSISLCHSPEKLLKEFPKCTVLCANCHRLYHIGEIQIPSMLNPLFVPDMTTNKKSSI